MAYNIYETANRILGLKNDWNNASAAGDTAKANQIAANAQNFYKQLRDNGNDAMAQKLSESNYEQSRKYINDYFAAQGRSATRPYFYNLGKKYGMSESDIDKALKFNETTGEVSLGGKNLGKPAAISSDGVSYWDNDTLDNAFNDYVSRTGASRGMKNASIQETDNMFKSDNRLNNKYMQYFDDYMGMVRENPFTSDTGKSILGQYNLKGYTGRNNALAQGAASNGGNIDSYSAANAMRQQAALTAQGQAAALEAYNSRLANAKDATAILEGARQQLQSMGVHINDTVSNNEAMLNGDVERSETVKNGDVSRAATTAQVTGKVPTSMSYSTNPYFNSDGTLINDKIDYAQVIENAKAMLANAKTDEEKANWNKVIENATQAGTYKITNDPRYTPYYDAWSQKYPMSYAAEPTEESRQFDEGLANSERIVKMGYDHEDKQLEMKNQQEKDMADINANATIRVNDASSKNRINEGNASSKNRINEGNATAQNTINVNDALSKNRIDEGDASTQNQINYYKETGNGLDGTKSSNNNSKPVVSDSKVKEWLKFFNEKGQEWHEEDSIVSENGNYVVKNDAEYIAYCILNDASIDGDQKEYLIEKFNVPTDAVEAATRQLENEQGVN